MSSVFQYSLANLVWCNTSRPARRPAAGQFQYSLANLVWCNLIVYLLNLYQRKFQYSLANLVWCNVPPRSPKRPVLGVSVFSGESRVV